MGLHGYSCHLKVSFQLGKSSVISSDRNLHSRIPWGLDCPASMVDPHSLFDLWMVSPFWDLHWQKAMYNVPCLIPSTWMMMMMTNRILTGYCPLGSGSGPIGALLMGSRMNGYNASVSLILLNSWEWFEAALV